MRKYTMFDCKPRQIANFVYFVRKRVLCPRAFEQELHNTLLEAELKQSGRNEQAHLEQEFEGYDQLYPRE
jgi:hypothetical protein